MNALKLVSRTALVGAVCLAAAAQRANADTPVKFETDIAPIFEQQCIACHMPGNTKGDLSLATFADLKENGYAVAGDPDGSYLLDLVTPSADQPAEMPKGRAPLSAEQIALLRRWIAEGAHWPKGLVLREKSKADSTWWSLQPLAVETSGGGERPSDVLDEFVDRKLAEKGLSRNPPADRRTLIRRATYDLIGLPPTPAEVAAFVNDADPNAYEKLIDRLLASPHYGEHWGRHWLDVVRFGESNGYERNVIIDNLWPFRDYVIRSLNEDKPFDQFIREHLAGDVFGKNDPEVAIGSAFLVAGPYDDVGNQDPVQKAQIRANTLDEIIRATGEAFLGLTVGCARCHDHKFDPILQEDYYALYATFSGIRHGSVPLATPAEKMARADKLQPLEQRRDELTRKRNAITGAVMARARQHANEYERQWTEQAVSREGTAETFPPVTAKFIRLTSLGQDLNPENRSSFGIDEFEVFAADDPARNVASAANGAKASGPARKIEDFPGAYGPQKAIDGKTGERFLAIGGYLSVEFAQPEKINRVIFSSARGEETPEHRKFNFVCEYRIEVSDDGQMWTTVADSFDRRPVNPAHLNKRLREAEITPEEKAQQAKLSQELAAVNREIAQVPPLPTVWMGSRIPADAKGPFHVFVGGNPQRAGKPVVPTSLAVLGRATPGYELPADATEDQRRLALADWLVEPENPLTPRVLANRIWHYHFGTGIVDTPSDFGYMGGKPSHPALLDWLAKQLQTNGWRIKPLHKLIMMSQTYRQSGDHQPSAAKLDGAARLLWRFPPRRLSAEEVRDTVLSVADKLDTTMGGPGFRLYHFMQDNVCTYVPLDEVGSETYRRAVYHQNARASVVDLMTEFDQPDCAFSTPRRAQTVTPLQALTMLNHSFSLEMADFFANRLQHDAGDHSAAQIRRAYQLCYSRDPSAEETAACEKLIKEHGLAALCRVLLNTSELIYVQ